MDSSDAEKTAFPTPIGNFHYTVMSFGLKNAGANYQRAMTAIFHDMLHGCLKDYVDDIVKSREVDHHVDHLKRVFARCHKYKLKMNSLKCAFEVSLGKFLRFIVHCKGIDLDSIKAKAIRDRVPPKSIKQLKSFLGKVSYIRRFIPGLAEILKQFQRLLKKDVAFEWKGDQQAAF